MVGLPAGDDVVEGAIEGAIRTQLKTIPGAKLTFHIEDQPALDIGNSQGLDVKVAVDAPRSFAKEGIVHVALKNLPIGRKTEGELWYCNDPESLKQPGALFSAPSSKRARCASFTTTSTMRPIPCSCASSS